MKINPIVFLIIFLLFSHQITAQQVPQYTMYMFDRAVINPAYAGSSDYMVYTLKHRNQFVGMEGAPTTQVFNFHMPIQRRTMGIGAKFMHDKIAIMQSIQASAYYAYHLNLSGGKLSLGLEAGINRRTINYAGLNLHHQFDNVLPAGISSAIVPDVSWGIYYSKQDFYIGFSQIHMLNARFTENEEITSDSRMYNHTNLLIGHAKELNNKLSFQPSVLVKLLPANLLQLDFNALIYYNNLAAIGIQYRTSDAIIALLRFNIGDDLRISYSYDITTSKLSPYSKGAHEILVSYGIKLPPPPTQKEIHPRYYF
jgi:type IX secretion system PorP/SprF family membrane protein